MVTFKFYYDKDSHKARIDLDDKTLLVEDIICMVPTSTERRDTPPKFFVKGVCRFAKLHSTPEMGTVVVLSNKPYETKPNI